MYNRIKLGLLLLLTLLSLQGLASPLSEAEIPTPLKSWEAWVLHDADTRRCPLQFNQADQRACIWPTQLALSLKEDGGSFTLSATGYAADWMSLPGDDSHWPQEVRIDNVPVPVIQKDDSPVVWLAPGSHHIDGRFIWNHLPESLPTPPTLGLIALEVSGVARANVVRDSAGNVWLGKAAVAAADSSDHLSLKVYRLVDDDIPLRMTVHVDLEVAGRSREVVLGPALPKDFIPLTLSGGLPARLDDDGKLHVQLRPGLWNLEFTGRAPGPTSQLGLAAIAAPWPAQEIWSLQPHNDLRVVEPTGAEAIDPRQTQMPDAWRKLPAFAMSPGTTLELVEKQRGSLQAEPDAVNLRRQLWLDFNGGGWTLHDDIDGNLRRHWRIDTRAPLALGRVDIDNQPQLITHGADGGAGVEVRHGSLNLQADSRIDSSLRRLPVTGWNVDFQKVDTTLKLPPGWWLFATAGVDNVPGTWLSQWSLLDLFLVLIIAIAALRLFGWRTGVLTVLALALSWHEPDAPRWSWLNLIAVLALVVALPEAFRQQALMRWLRRYAWFSAALLVLVTLPYAVEQARWALYPQLESQSQEGAHSLYGTLLATSEESKSAPAPPVLAEAAPAPEEAAPAADMASLQQPMANLPKRAMSLPAKVLAGSGQSLAQQPLTQLLPNQITQTGPGLPDWNWRSVSLSWSGPVVAGQSLRLWLLPPWVVRLWRVASIAGIGVVLMMWLRGALPRAGSSLPTGRRAGAAAGLLSIALVFAIGALPDRALADDVPAPAADSNVADSPVKPPPQPPPQQILDELKKRLLAPADCATGNSGVCADSPRLAIEVKGDALLLRMTVDALADTAVAVPAPPFNASQPQAVWQPTLVQVDGRQAPLQREADSGELWIAVTPGHHEVQLGGSLAGLTQLQLPLPLQPHQVQANAQGWDVAGINDDGSASDALQLSRQQSHTSVGAVEAGAEQILPGFMIVTRTLHLGLDWNVDTSLRRIGTVSTPVVVRVPMLAGEVLTTDAVHAKEGIVEIAFAAGQEQAGWTSRLPVTPVLNLQAPQTRDFVEQWQLDASPLWHVETSGIAPVQVQQNDYWLPGWQPWPGESVSLKITRPEGIKGQVLTLDKASETIAPGARATDLTLELHLRASQGGQQWLQLPEGAEVQKLAVDGAAEPAHMEKGRLALPLHPGDQQISLQLRFVRDLTAWLRTPAIDPGLPGVNADITLDLPQDRWLLWLRGPQLGPAVLFWGLLVVLVVVGIGLARLPLTPLRAHHWVLLLIGLSQAPLWSLVVVVALWLLLGLRGRITVELSVRRFQLMQIGLALLTLLAAALLFDAVAQGLLGYPDMQIAGNDSYSHHLHWYQDRFDQGVPTVALLSVPIWVYRLLMLLWSLWLANALLGWLRWGWTQYIHQGLWKKAVKAMPPPVPTVTAEVAVPAPPPEAGSDS